MKSLCHSSTVQPMHQNTYVLTKYDNLITVRFPSIFALCFLVLGDRPKIRFNTWVEFQIIYFTAICSWGSDWPYFITGSQDSLLLNKSHTIILSNDGPDCWPICTLCRHFGYFLLIPTHAGYLFRRHQVSAAVRPAMQALDHWSEKSTTKMDTEWWVWLS